ncbi:MarR family winged helix-turn-helix transcriptional regulator [Novosphingobium sp. FKTRR1]|uniref:MarR family winged helix-turn-helix transcriptional regulator n=1 Tax=Novosphingobium sp. FKTRR1 TaxID=2879118 RepID=UPI001CF0153B|nr:MarR family winged helix-turn-helix transcriptional regulator [Novosphingobium sp. FKTRR1]
MPGSKTRLRHFLPYRLAVTSNAISGMIAGEYRNEFGLKIPEWRVMAVLGDAGPLTQRDLVRATLMDKVAVNRACKVLDERELIRRSPNESDGRSHHLELTPAGVELHGKIWPQAVGAYERIFAALSPRETERLAVLLDKLFARVEALEEGEG